MTEQTRTDIVLKGIGVSPGINIGRAYLVDGGSLETPAYCYLDTTYISSEVKRFKNAVQESKDQLMKIRNRLLKDGKGKKHETISEIKEEVIVVAHDLAPTDTAQMVKGKVLGFLTDIGGKTSHTAIVARYLEIPAVVGLESISQKVNAGDTII